MGIAKINKEKHEKEFLSINRSKIDIFSTLFSFFFIWEVYWRVFNLISPQDTIIDILAIFGVIIIVIPCTVILKSKMLDFLKK